MRIASHCLVVPIASDEPPSDSFYTHRPERDDLMPPDIDTMQAHETRISLLEQQNADVRSTLKELTNDVRQLVAVMTQQAEDRAALKRAFEQIDKLDQRFDAIEKRIDDAERSRLQARIAEQDKAIEDDNRTRRALVFEIGRNVIIIAAALFAYHLGVKLL